MQLNRGAAQHSKSDQPGRKRVLRAVGLSLLAIAGYAAIRIGVLAHQERRQSEIEVVGTLAVDYILDSTDERWGIAPFSEDYDVTSSASVLVRNGTHLYEIVHPSSETAFSSVKVNGAPPESFAIDNDDTLLTVTGGYFGMLDSRGNTVDAVPLPLEGMRLAHSVLDGMVYLYGGDASDYRLYSFDDSGGFGILAKLDQPIVSVSDNGESVYIATASRIYRLQDGHLSVVLQAYKDEIGDSIVSVAATPGDLVMFSTGSRVYALRSGLAVSIVNNSGGALRLRGDKLYVLDRSRSLLYTLTSSDGGRFAGGGS